MQSKYTYIGLTIVCMLLLIYIQILQGNSIYQSVINMSGIITFTAILAILLDYTLPDMEAENEH